MRDRTRMIQYSRSSFVLNHILLFVSTDRRVVLSFLWCVVVCFVRGACARRVCFRCGVCGVWGGGGYCLPVVSFGARVITTCKKMILVSEMAEPLKICSDTLRTKRASSHVVVLMLVGGI